MFDPEASQDYTSDNVAVLDTQTSLGQSFISRRPNMNGITIWLTKTDQKSGEIEAGVANSLTVKLFSTPGDLTPIYKTTVIVPSSANNRPITISIPSLKNPSGQSFYIVLANDSGTIQVNGRNEDAYPLGKAYINNQPIDADIAFRLSYDYGFSALLQDAKNTIPDLWIIAPLLAILWLPGWLLLDFSGLRSHYDFGEQTALAITFSLASIPVIMLWTTVLKLRWNAQSLFITTGVLTAILIIRIIYNAVTTHLHKRSSDVQTEDTISPSCGKIKFIADRSLALILIFIICLATRLIMVRDLATPAWVDSVHHALITRLIMDSGSYPATYLPYWTFTPTSYHPGFHSIAAAFTWLSQLDLAHSLLLLGQVLNALMVFSVYLLAKTLTRSTLTGLLASIITGFLSPMPAYYTSWGRYTELTGLLLLPVIPALVQLWLNGNHGKRKTGWIISLSAITAAGLFMIHYRVLAFMVCLVFSYVILQILFQRHRLQIKPARLFIHIIAIALLAIIAVFPWFYQTIKTTLVPSITPSLTVPVPFFQGFSWSYLTSALGIQALVIAGLGMLWSVLKEKNFAFILTLWVIILLLLANLASFRLPGSGLITNSSVEIMLFIPISIFGGYFIRELLITWRDLIPTRLVRPLSLISLMLIGYVAFLGARQLIPILNPITILSRKADLSAINWVRQNILPDETIVINPFSWGYGLYGGNDGGYWISPLAGQVTLPAPVLYGLDSNAEQISQFSQEVMKLGSSPAEFWEYLHAHQLRYVYIGARGGIIAAERLASSGLFNLLYHQDGVWILSAKP